MAMAELLIEEIKTLPDECVVEVLDFVGYLKAKAMKQKECPLCARHCDPQTDEPRFNAKTTAAFAEGDAMLAGEVPAQWYNSAEEMFEDLDK